MAWQQSPEPLAGVQLWGAVRGVGCVRAMCECEAVVQRLVGWESCVAVVNAEFQPTVRVGVRMALGLELGVGFSLWLWPEVLVVDGCKQL